MKQAPCLHCGEPATIEKQVILYFGTSTQKLPVEKHKKRHYCSEECYTTWWNDLTWHLDTLDERMNANIHLNRTNGLEGTYKGKKAHASWNGLEAKHKLGEYEFKNRRPHPDSCKGCSLDK